MNMNKELANIYEMDRLLHFVLYILYKITYNY